MMLNCILGAACDCVVLDLNTCGGLFGSPSIIHQQQFSNKMILIIVLS